MAAPGEVGELHVRGASVMQGYWGDPDRTSRSRIVNTFSEGLTDPVYRTGDLVIEEPDGNYTFLGRRDNQIKSRGYRIELGEIETALYAHPEIRECAAMAIPDEMITNRIKAYVVAGTELEHELSPTSSATRSPSTWSPAISSSETCCPRLRRARSIDNHFWNSTESKETRMNTQDRCEASSSTSCDSAARPRI